LNESIELRNYKFDSDEIPLVSISCITYNHKQYIRDAIEGFLMQITNFPVEILIHDDASTDGTTEIIKEYEKRYPNLIKPLYEEENQWVKGRRGSVVFNIPRAQGKYIAFCEGDDYWTDPYKLQKQVDFLESHPDIGLIHTELDHYYVKEDRYVKNHWKTCGVINQSGDIYEDLLLGNKSMIYACTACLRKELLQDLNYDKFGQKIFQDRIIWLHIAAKAKIGYIDQSTAVRRVLPYSLTQGRSFEYWFEQLLESYRLFDEFNSIRPFSEGVKERFMQNKYKYIFNLCYSYDGHINELREYYHKLNDKNIEIRLKYYLKTMHIPKIVSKAIMKLWRIFNNIYNKT